MSRDIRELCRGTGHLTTHKFSVSFPKSENKINKKNSQKSPKSIAVKDEAGLPLITPQMSVISAENRRKESSRKRSKPIASVSDESKVIDVPITNAHLRAINAERIYSSRPIPQTRNEVQPKPAPTPLLSLVVVGAPGIPTKPKFPEGVFSATLDDGRASLREVFSFLEWDRNTLVTFTVANGVLKVREDASGVPVVGRDLRMLLPLRQRRQLQIAPNARICLVAQKTQPKVLVIYPEHQVLALLERRTSQ